MAHTPYALADATTLNSTPPAYPQVQPLKASLFFDSAKGLGEWRIFMSTTAVKDMRKYLRDKKIFKIILKKLRELSKGLFSDNNQKRLQGPSNGIPIFEAKLTGDLRIIYQIDMMADFERNCETQGIRVFGIFTHAQTDDRMWASLSAQLAVRGSEYRRRIQFRPRPRANGDKVFLPQSWPDASSAENRTDDASMTTRINEADRALIHQWLVLEKYSALSTALVNWILSDKDSVPLFSVSPHERTIIEHISSCYVLGRSGTGKTTVMTFKMFGIERAAQVRASGLEYRPRQLFVTQSPVLAGRVKEFYVKFTGFLLSATGVIHDPVAEQEHLDGGELGDPEDDEDLLGSLPRRFSELQDKHFPLFLTFDKLCKLVEADLGITLARPTSTKEQKRAGRRYRILDTGANEDFNLIADGDFGFPTAADSAGPSEETIRSCLVDFESFHNNYWPHFPQELTRRLDPALVFSEILGVIEGSEEACHSKNMYLSREAYLELSDRTRPTFAGHRERVYLLFEKYMALKRRYGHYDLADRARAILQKLKGDYQYSVDYLYVDEAQDNLIMDTLLLRRLCCNPHGLFWAGDTAQTIAIGSSFRFDDLKASLYRLERDMYAVAPEKLVEPEFFQLTTNYRSHGGIVNCAGLIVELITHFWPYSIDALQKERGVVDGPKPIFFTGCNEETVRYEQFLQGKNGSSVEFGAEQCILVRNDRARKQLRKEVGKIGVILTLYESKGLEFDDVLLYDFFEDSSCSLSQWRVVLNFSPDLEGASSAPRFDELLHAGLCIELKCLYVAITRARKNLWIMDRSAKGEPMKVLLVRNGKVEVRTAENAPRLAKFSTPEQWAKTGERLFNNKRYTQAMHCFDHAGLPIKRDIAEAYYLRHKARNVPRHEGEQARIEAYKKAGSAFFNCAGNVFASRKKYYHISAECFREARDNVQAALAHENAEEYTDAAKCFAKAMLFEDAVRIVKTKKSVDRGVASRIIGAARLHYVHEGKLKRAMDVELFDSQEELLEYMDDYGFETAKAEVLEKVGRYQQAADVYFREGREDQSIHVLLKDVQNPKSLERAMHHLLTRLWRQYSFGRDSKQCGAEGIDPFHHIREINKICPSIAIPDEFALFEAMKRDDRYYLLRTYPVLLGTNPQAAVLLLDFLLAREVVIDGMQNAVQYLKAYSAYAKNLRLLWNHLTPMSNRRTWRLFAFRKRSEDEDKGEDEYLVTQGACLAEHATSGQPDSSRITAAGIVLDAHELRQAIRSCVKTRLRRIVELEASFFSKNRRQYLGSPCLNHALRGRCSYSDCDRLHIDSKSIDIAWFNGRVQMILLHLLFLREADFVICSNDLHRQRNECLTELFRILNPPLLALGSMANISKEYIRELANGVKVVFYWAENRIYGIYPRHLDKPWILDAVTEVAALTLWGDRDKARKLLDIRFQTGKMAYFVNRRYLGCLGILELIRGFDSFDPEFLASGNSFISIAIQSKLPIDISYVCRLIELLSAASILLYKDRTRDGFHDTLLPKSWLLLMIPKLNFDRGRSSWLPVRNLIEHSTDLARYLLSDSGHFRAGNAMRILSVLRICRSMSLVAYNMNKEIKELALQRMALLRQACTNVDFVLKSYILSKSWPDLRRATELSVLPSKLDWMARLILEGCSTWPLSTAARVEPIRFKNRDDLFSRFSRKTSSFKLSANAEPFVPRMVNSLDASAIDIISEPRVDGDDPVTAIEESQAMEDEQNEDDTEHILGESTEPVGLQSTANLPSEEIAAGLIILRFLRMVVHNRKEQAARMIQRWFKSIRALRSERELPGFRGRRARFYKACVAADHKRGLRLLFLGVMPDLLACLDALQGPVHSNKDRARKQLSLKLNDKQIDYEEVHLRITQANTLKSRFEALKSDLKDISEGRAELTLECLRKVVDSMIGLFDELNKVGEERDRCLEINGFIRERKSRPYQRQSRPALNTSDLDDMYYDDWE